METKKPNRIRREKLKIVDSKDFQPTSEGLKKIREIFGSLHRNDGRYDVIFERATDDIDKCKLNIESWYDPESKSHNGYLVGGLEYEEGLNKLLRLQNHKPDRVEIYNWFEKQSKKALKSFVNSICNNPDLIHRGQITGAKRDHKIVCARDFEQKAVALYRSAEENIKKVVEKENAKIAKKQNIIGFELPPIEVKIDNPLSSVVIFPHKPEEIKTLFIKDISSIIKPYLPATKDRAGFIREVFLYFYGVPDEAIDPESIRKIPGF